VLQEEEWRRKRKRKGTRGGRREIIKISLTLNREEPLIERGKGSL
jgi:hypothetical protein